MENLLDENVAKEPSKEYVPSYRPVILWAVLLIGSVFFVTTTNVWAVVPLFLANMGLTAYTLTALLASKKRKWAFASIFFLSLLLLAWMVHSGSAATEWYYSTIVICIAILAVFIVLYRFFHKKGIRKAQM